jgi:hypothetical protein
MGQQALYGFQFEADGALCGLNQVAGLAHVRNRMPDEKAAIIAVMLKGSRKFDCRNKQP